MKSPRRVRSTNDKWDDSRIEESFDALLRSFDEFSQDFMESGCEQPDMHRRASDHKETDLGHR